MANPTLFDEGVEAARNACVAGASISSAAITIAAYCDNPLTGIPALRELLGRLKRLEFDTPHWLDELSTATEGSETSPMSFPGFGYVNRAQSDEIYRTCQTLAVHDSATAPYCQFYLRHRATLESRLGALNSTGLAALAFAAHGIEEDDAERLFLLWKTEPALVAAQRARRDGMSLFPFHSKALHYEGPMPAKRTFDFSSLARQVGLE